MSAIIRSLARAWRIAPAVAALSVSAAPAIADPLVGELPEPATLLLLAVGLILLWWGLKKRKP